MIYTLIGKAVVKAAKLFLRRKYGTTKPLVAGGVLVVAIAVLVALLRRES